MMPYQRHPDYDELPEPIKAMYSAEEYAWMGEEQRATLVECSCLPEVEEDE